MELTLSNIKKHLNIDHSEDDAYLSGLTIVAQTAIENEICYSFSGFTSIPEPLQHAVFLLVGNLYSNREPVAFANPVIIPYTIAYLINPYKIYYSE